MREAHTSFEIATRGRGLAEITAPIVRWIGSSGVGDGLVTVFLRHTSASLLIQENADPTVQHDLERFFARLAPDGDPLFEHVDEGPDDMPAHVRAAVLPTMLSIPLVGGRLVLGTWQGIYVYEHRRHGHRREVVVQAIGTPAAP